MSPLFASGTAKKTRIGSHQPLYKETSRDSSGALKKKRRLFGKKKKIPKEDTNSSNISSDTSYVESRSYHGNYSIASSSEVSNNDRRRVRDDSSHHSKTKPKSRATLEKESKNFFNMGNLYSSEKLEQFPKAKQFFEQCLEARLNLHEGPYHIEVAQVYEKLGDVSVIMNLKDDAREYYENSLDSLDHITNNPPPKVKTKSKGALSISFEKKKEIDLEEMKQRIETSLEPLPPSTVNKPPVESISTSNISNMKPYPLQHSKLSSASSITSHENDDKTRVSALTNDDEIKTLDTSNSLFSPVGESVSSSYPGYFTPNTSKQDKDYSEGIINFIHGNYVRAKANFNQSYINRIQKYGEDSKEASYALEKLADTTIMSKGILSDAESYYKGALRLMMPQFGKNERVKRILLSSGFIHLRNQHHGLALECYSTGADLDNDLLHCYQLNNPDAFTQAAIDAHESTAKHFLKKGAVEYALLHYTQAMHLLRPILLQSPNHARGEDQYARIAKTLGNLHGELKNYSSAIEMFLQNLRVRGGDCDDVSNIPIRNKKKVVTIYHNMGILYEKTSNSHKAMECYNKCLKLKEELYGNYDARLAKTVNCMGYVYFVQNQDDNALRHFQRAIAIWKESGTNVDVHDYSAALNGMAIIYSRRNDTVHKMECLDEKARLMTNAYVSSQEKSGDQEELGGDCQNFGLKLLEDGEHERAAVFFEQELRVKQNVETAGGDEEFATLLQCLGTVTSITGKSEALDFYNQSLDKTKSILTKALVMDQMAILCCQLLRIDDGLDLYKKALSFPELLPGGDHDDLGVLLANNMGVVYMHKGNDRKAMDTFQKAILISTKESKHSRTAIFTTLKNIGALHVNHIIKEMILDSQTKNGTFHQFSTDSPSLSEGQDLHDVVATIQENVGTLDARLGRHDNAIEAWNKSLQFNQTTFGPESQENLDLLSHIGTAYFMTQKYQKSIECYKNAHAIVKNIPENDLKLATLLNKMGNVCSKLHNYPAATDHYRQAMILKQNLYNDDNHKEILLLRHNIGLILCKEKRFDEAEEYLNDVLQRKRQTLGNTHPDIAKVICDIGGLYYAKKNYPMAKEYCLDAMRILKETGTTRDHPYVHHCKNTLKKIKKSAVTGSKGTVMLSPVQE